MATKKEATKEPKIIEYMGGTFVRYYCGACKSIVNEKDRYCWNCGNHFSVREIKVNKNERL